MRSAIIASAFAALAVANPIPQEIDLSAIGALPTAAVSAAPVDVASQTVSVKASAAATSVGVAVVTATAVPSSTAQKREVFKRDCAAQPSGSGPVSS